MNFNIFELEMLVKERRKELEKLSFGIRAAQVPMLDWLLVAAIVVCIVGAIIA